MSKLSLHATGSSHLKPLDQKKALDKHKARPLQDLWFPEASSLESFPGLTIMPQECKPFSVPPIILPEKSGNRIDQLADCRKSIQDTTASLCLFVGFSNDWVYFLMKNQHLLPLCPAAESFWENLSNQEKAEYNVRDRTLLTSASRKHLKGRISDMEREIVSLFASSGLEKVFFSSILERLLPGQQFVLLPLYFAVLNSYFRKLVKKLDSKGIVMNRFGKPIEFRFINVAKQFFDADRKTGLFKKSEVKSGIMTHRNFVAMEELFRMYAYSIHKDLSSSSVA